MASNEYIYLDNAATTAVDSRVVRCMEPYWSGEIGNPESLHVLGVRAHECLREARSQVAQVLHAVSDEIIFTAGGTESNNLALQGVVRAHVHQGKSLQDIHLVTSTIEHSSVRQCLDALERQGVRVSQVPVDSEGFVDLEVLQQTITKDTVLVSMLYVHNEIGTIARIKDISRIIRQARERFGTTISFHTDASQAPAWVSCNVEQLGVDMMTFASQKVYGPKGVGCLYRKRSVPLAPILYGGTQEFGLRPGTPAMPLIAGFSAALGYVTNERTEYEERIRTLRDESVAAILAACPGAVLNGATGYERVANNINLSFPRLDGEHIVLELDARGIGASTRSACLKSTDPGSYVVASLGKGVDYARGTVRLTLARNTTQEQMTKATNALIEVVAWLHKGV